MEIKKCQGESEREKGERGKVKSRKRNTGSEVRIAEGGKGETEKGKLEGGKGKKNVAKRGEVNGEREK